MFLEKKREGGTEGGRALGSSPERCRPVTPPFHSCANQGTTESTLRPQGCRCSWDSERPALRPGSEPPLHPPVTRTSWAQRSCRQSLSKTGRTVHPASEGASPQTWEPGVWRRGGKPTPHPPAAQQDLLEALVLAGAGSSRTGACCGIWAARPRPSPFAVKRADLGPSRQRAPPIRKLGLREITAELPDRHPPSVCGI